MSTSGNVQYIGGDIMTTLGDIMSTSGDVQYNRGFQKVFTNLLPHMHHDIPPCTEHPPPPPPPPRCTEHTLYRVIFKIYKT